MYPAPPLPTDQSDLNTRSGDSAAVKRWILVSGVFLVIQVLAIDFSSDRRLNQVAQFAVGACLLGLVYFRRSRIARGILVIYALVGAVIYGFAAFSSIHAIVMIAAYLGEALPLLTGPVRRHVQQHD